LVHLINSIRAVRFTAGGRSRISYAGQRCGLHLDGVKSGRKAKRSYVADQVRIIAAGLGLDEQSTAAMTAGARLLPYAEGEIIQRVNTVPEEVGFITEGEAGMFARAEEGRNLPIGELGVGDYLGGTALTRQRMQVGVVALTDTTVIGVPRRAIEEVVRRDHRLARQIGDSVELRRKAASEALEEAALGLR